MKRILIATILVIMMAMSGMAAADVQEDWPLGVPNTHIDKHVLIDFECGTSYDIVTSPTDRITFENDGINPWVYGCKGGSFNIYDPVTRPNSSYVVNGNCGAWCNITGHHGNISFKNGASHVSILASTPSGLCIDAYNESGALVTSSGMAPSNLGTLNFTRISVDRDECDIYNVCIHDTGNYWVIDDLLVVLNNGESRMAHCQRFIHSNGTEHWNVPDHVPDHVAERWDPCE